MGFKVFIHTIKISVLKTRFIDKNENRSRKFGVREETCLTHKKISETGETSVRIKNKNIEKKRNIYKI